AHNVASAEALVAALLASFPERGRRLLIFGASNDKDVPGMFRALAPHFAAAYLTRSVSPRSVPPDVLCQWWREAGGQGASAHEPPELALEAARAAAAPDDLVCVAGSVFLAGELRPLLAGRTGLE